MAQIAFDQTRAHEKLLKLSRNPYDLTHDGALDGDDRLNRFVCSSNHFSYHYWAQRVNDEVLDSLQDLADECDLVGQYLNMKTGSVMNAIEGHESENRQVLHTACRDIFSGKPLNPEATGDAQIELGKLKEFIDEVDRGVLRGTGGKEFRSIIHIGIGGSDLGPRSIYEALKAYRSGNRCAHFVANVDPDDLAANFKGVELESCLVNIVSKSGTTLETLTNEKLVRQLFEEKNLDPADHFIAVTGKGSPMDDRKKYLRSFYMFDYIGGRYSSTSMVGLTTLAFTLGFDRVEQFLKGAQSIDYHAEERDIRNNIPLLMALIGIWNRNYLHQKTLAVLPYSQALHRFPAHLQQCDMESNGKSVGRNGVRVKHETGPVVWGEPGTNGQHAFYQLLHQGTERVPVEFIGFRKSQYGQDIEVENTTSQQKLFANMIAQSVAFATGRNNSNPNRLFPGNRPSSVLIAERLTSEIMGELLALYEAKIVYQGFAWNINSFDQEGVQLGKHLANQFLNEMKGGKGAAKTFHQKILEITGMA